MGKARKWKRKRRGREEVLDRNIRRYGAGRGQNVTVNTNVLCIVIHNDSNTNFSMSDAIESAQRIYDTHGDCASNGGEGRKPVSRTGAEPKRKSLVRTYV